MKEEIILKVNGSEWTKLMDEAFLKLNKNAKIDGFRPGKAPRDVYEKKHGKGDIIYEALDKAVQNKYEEILKEGKIQVVMEPKVEPVKVDEDGIEVKFVFISEPKITLGEYKNLGVKKETIKVTKKEIEEAITHLQNDYAEVMEKDGNIAMGDIAIIDYEGFKDGIAFEGGKGENYSLTIGSNSFIPGFEEGLVGMAKEEEKDLQLTFPKDYMSEELKGQKVIFKVKVNDVKERIIPKLDADFFADLGMENVKTKEELEKQIESEIKEQKEKQNENVYIDAVLEKAIKNAKFDIAHELYHDEAHHMYEELLERMSMQGISEEMYLQFTNSTAEDIISKMEEEAEKRVKGRYLIKEIIKAEKIKVTAKEVNAEIKKMMETYNVSEEEIIKELGSKEYVEYNLLFKKAIDFLKEN